MRKLEKVSARLSFSPKYRRAVAKNATKPLIFMYHEAVSIFLGSTNVLISVYFWDEYIFGVKNFLNLVYFWVFQKYTVSDPPRHIPIEVPPLGFIATFIMNFNVKLPILKYFLQILVIFTHVYQKSAEK